MRTVDQLIDDVIAREGGYVNHKADRGGETCWGVTIAVARQNGYDGLMRDMPRGVAVAIYRKLYWARPGFDRIAPIAPGIAAELFDTGINMGPTTAIAFLQRALNALNRGGSDYPDLTADGALGPRTVEALRGFLRTRGAASEAILLRAMEALQGERYISLAESRPANEAFVYGWLANRVAAL